MESLSMMTMVTLASILCVGKGQTANKCNHDFIKKIENIMWTEFGEPNHILNDGSKAGKEFIILTTEDYYQRDARCIYTEFGDDGKTVKLITVSGSVTSTPEDDPLEEHNGVVEETDTHIKRVHIYSKDDIVVWYKCMNSGGVGDLEVAMKVKHGSYDKEKVDQVKDLIYKKLAINFTKSYPHDCDVTNKNKSKDSKEK